ncbi:Gfo/Idh/MocA family protein [Cryptosporangium aurantiacum]|uniref:Predicted dehydrogenase n=1 Tax=Cryptosporangium aurantiacum TaxID=134849 RepID=A0A1M7RJ56_9ACTN|nr:Gfo/Idh/MocA family oxidoreductase [Cryptosporangium aurantiacum]SHN46182.1 Predicted dehydrogenase [Cryptosporangium aurantiacum]
MTDELRVAVVGLGWMGQVHARAWTRLPQHYPDLGLRPRLVAAADPVPSLRALASSYGFDDFVDDWRVLVARNDLDVVSVTGPNHVHRDVGVAVARAGKHLWIEKPAGRNAAETAEIAAAVEAAGVCSAAGFNYRNAPAVSLARSLVADGRLGRVEQVDVRFLADYSAHPQGALSWRFFTETAGSGVLGDLVCHGTDLARYVVGELTELVADEGRFIASRPKPAAAGSHFARGTGPHGPVENEDYIGALLRFASGARGTLTASRVAVGEQSAYEIVVHGDRGAVAWDFRRMGELRVCLDQDYQDASWSTVLVGRDAGELARFQPAAGNAMGYDDLKVIEAHRLATSIVGGVQVGATIADALVAARTVEAMATSIAERRWVTL